MKLVDLNRTQHRGSMVVGYTIRQKKDYLLAFQNYAGTHTQFCVEHGLLKGTFSKWLKDSAAILVTPDECTTVKRTVTFEDEKRALVSWIEDRRSKGYQVDVVALLAHAKKTVPHILAKSRSYNSEYVLCRRLLLETRLRVNQRELEDASESLLHLSVTHGSCVDVSNVYEHGDTNRYVNCTARTVKLAVEDFGSCTCVGKRIDVCIIQYRH